MQSIIDRLAIDDGYSYSLISLCIRISSMSVSQPCYSGGDPHGRLMTSDSVLLTAHWRLIDAFYRSAYTSVVSLWAVLFIVCYVFYKWYFYHQNQITFLRLRMPNCFGRYSAQYGWDEPYIVFTSRSIQMTFQSLLVLHSLISDYVWSFRVYRLYLARAEMWIVIIARGERDLVYG